MRACPCRSPPGCTVPGAWPARSSLTHCSPGSAAAPAPAVPHCPGTGPSLCEKGAPITGCPSLLPGGDYPPRCGAFELGGWGGRGCSPGWGAVGSSASGPCWEACSRISRTCRQTRISIFQSTAQIPYCILTPWICAGPRGAQASSQEHLLELCPMHAMACTETLPASLSHCTTHLLAPSQVQGRVAAALPVPCLPVPLCGELGVGAVLCSRGWLSQIHGQLLLLRVSVCVATGL